VRLNVKPAPASPFSTLTISLGISVMHPAEEITPKQLLGRADAALYQAKREGRNCYRTSWKEHP
jgi:diguanylate cyclase (GGDEF)-like protein